MPAVRAGDGGQGSNLAEGQHEAACGGGPAEPPDRLPSSPGQAARPSRRTEQVRRLTQSDSREGEVNLRGREGERDVVRGASSWRSAERQWCAAGRFVSSVPADDISTGRQLPPSTAARKGDMASLGPARTPSTAWDADDEHASTDDDRPIIPVRGSLDAARAGAAAPGWLAAAASGSSSASLSAELTPALVLLSLPVLLLSRESAGSDGEVGGPSSSRSHLATGRNRIDRSTLPPPSQTPSSSARRPPLALQRHAPIRRRPRRLRLPCALRRPSAGHRCRSSSGPTPTTTSSA